MKRYKKEPLSPQRKTRNESFGFFVSKKCQKFTFEHFLETKNQRLFKGVKVFALQGSPTGITLGNPLTGLLVFPSAVALLV
ncbi:MAG: hypothetical protein CUR32_02975 [Flavobacterium sp.]|nr:MAG: hypothetical protein CUR32_02975 [Flavobacterium sp.] [Flavobacterium sp. FEMGT703F]